MDRRTFLAVSGTAATIATSMTADAQKNSSNPFFQKWTTPYELPPFAQIKPEHFMPAYQEGMKQELADIEAIAGNSSEPNFQNTIEAMEKAGQLLDRVDSVFSNLSISDTNDQLQKIERDMAPLLSKHASAISQNEALFKRIDTIYQKRESLGLNPEQSRLVERYYKRFVRSGAKLPPEQKKRLAQIDEKLAELTTRFSQNLLADTAAFELVLDKKEDLAGLPESFQTSAAEAAKQSGKPGKWVITLQRSSVEPFLQLSSRRDLREKAFKAWAARGDNENQYDNKPVIREIILLRIEKAKLLNFPTFAHYAIDDAMAKTPDAAKGLMESVWKPAVATAKREADELQAAMKADGQQSQLEPWDWRYYSEKVRLAKYDLDEEQIKQYFPLDRMIEASFWVATRLFGITFSERKDLPKYHADVRSWEVKNADGKVIGIFYGDYFARPSKQSGAWMSSFRRQQELVSAIPVVINNLNFNKPPAGQQSLLTYKDAETLFHEFGHGLHGLLSKVVYPTFSGTNVPRDFVELPSQIYEHWLGQKEVLEKFARHYKTGETIPASLLDKIKKAENFNQGFETVEFLASGLVDMEWHLLDKPVTIDVREMEQNWLRKIGMPREIIMRHRSTHFAHIFANSYAAGYYSYLWSEVLDTDGFEAFKDAGDPFDPAIAKRLYQFIYSAGGTKDPMELYESFRGRKPDSQALMRHRGFAPPKK